MKDKNKTILSKTYSSNYSLYFFLIGSKSGYIFSRLTVPNVAVRPVEELILDIDAGN